MGAAVVAVFFLKRRFPPTPPTPEPEPAVEDTEESEEEEEEEGVEEEERRENAGRRETINLQPFRAAVRVFDRENPYHVSEIRGGSVNSEDFASFSTGVYYSPVPVEAPEN